jgi:hypothetical protein
MQTPAILSVEHDLRLLADVPLRPLDDTYIDGIWRIIKDGGRTAG